MKIKIIHIYLLVINLIINNLSLAQKNQTSSLPMPMISKDELKEIMQNAVDEYARLPEEEKELMSKQIGIKREELDEIMKEASAFVEEMNNTENKKEETTFEQKNSFIPTEPKEKINKTTNIKANTEYKNAIKEQSYIIDEAIKTLQILNIKAQDEFIREKIILNYDAILSSTEKITYYLLLIKKFLINNEDQIAINSSDIDKIVSISRKIVSLKDSIEKLITLNEYEALNKSNDLFQKYSIKKTSTKDLTDHLKKEITKLKEKIKSIEVESENTVDPKNKKDLSKKTIDLKYKIDILETDLTEVETNIAENKENSIQFDKYQKLLNESIEKIIKNLKNYLSQENAILEIENIIRKYFPAEYKIGKEKEEQIKKQILSEQKIITQKGSPGKMYLEENIKAESNNKETKNRTESQNPFQASSNNDYYEYSDQYEENENEFDFPQDDQKNYDKTSSENKNSIAENDKDLLSNKDKETSSDPIIKNKKNKKNKNSDHKDIDTKNNKKKKEEINNTLKNIENQIKDIQKNITIFLNENLEHKYQQENSELFSLTLKNQLDKLNLEFNTIKADSIKVLGKENPLKDLTEKLTATDSEKKTEYDKIYLIHELQKMKSLDISIPQENLSQLQLILYQLEDIKETLKKSFNPQKRPKDFKNLEKVFSLLEETILEYKKICRKMIETQKESITPKNPDKTNNISYWWLLTKEEIDEIIKQRNKIHKPIPNPENQEPEKPIKKII